MIVEFPPQRGRHVSEVDAAPQVARLAPGGAVLIIAVLSLGLWAAMIWGAIALCGGVNG